MGETISGYRPDLVSAAKQEEEWGETDVDDEETLPDDNDTVPLEASEESELVEGNLEEAPEVAQPVYKQKGLIDRFKKELAIMGAVAVTLAAGTADAKGKRGQADQRRSAIQKVERRTDATLNAHHDHGINVEVRKVADHDLTRLKDQEQLKRAIDQGLLVRVPDRGVGYQIAGNVGGHASANRDYYRYLRPYAKQLIDDLGAAYVAKGGKSFKLTSLVRTEEYQRRIARGNSNAGDIKKTSHTVGTTFDISRNSVNPKLVKWFEAKLLDLEKMGLVQATKERKQKVFHVMTMPEYNGQAKAKKVIKPPHKPGKPPQRLAQNKI